MVNVLNVALIGCKGPSKLHIEGYERCQRVKLAAVVDVDMGAADALAAKYGVEALYDIKDAYAKERAIDIIDLAVPTKLHARLAIDAANAGKNVLCEKPLCLGENEYRMMAEAFERSGTTLGSIFQCRFSDEAAELMEKIRSEQLGKILSATSVTNWWRDADYFGTGFEARRTYKTAGGGVLMVQAIHAIDLVKYLLGDPVWVKASTAIGGTGLPDYVKVEHTAEAHIGFRNGAIAKIDATIRRPEGGAKGDHIDKMSDEPHIITVTGDRGEVVIGEHMLDDPGELFSRNIADLALSISERRSPVVSLESAWKTVRMILAMYRSAEMGEKIELQ